MVNLIQSLYRKLQLHVCTQGKLIVRNDSRIVDYELRAIIRLPHGFEPTTLKDEETHRAIGCRYSSIVLLSSYRKVTGSYPGLQFDDRLRFK